MKVLFNTYPLAFFPPGGGEMQLLSYQENLSSFGVTVDLFDQWRPNLKKYDFIHFFSCMPGSLFFMRSVRKAGVPLIVSPNLWVTQETKGDYPFLEIQAQLLCADRVICNSDIECAELSQVFGVDRSKFATVYNGVSDFFIEESSGSLFRSKFSIDYQYVLNVANVEKRKNQLGFIRALKKFPELRLINIGYVRDSEYLEQCKLEGGSQFIHLGALDHRSPELRSAYAGCLFFALPSALETPGLAALEAAGVGAKVLITSVGSTQEYFKDYPVYVNPNSLDSMIAGISNILSMKNSISLRNYVREKFRWPVVITGLLNIYKNSRVVLNSKISMLNFYLEELDGNEWFAWSKAIASLKFPKGYLSFEWRAVESAIVDIWLNGTLIEEGVILGQSWTPFFIDASQGEDTQIIELRVIKSSNPFIGDRILGIALKGIDFLDSSQTHDRYDINEWSFGKNLLFNSVGIVHMGFHLQEKSGNEWFAWSKAIASLKFPKGYLSFEWRAVESAIVDIWLNGTLIEEGVILGQSWTPFFIDASQGEDTQIIEFRVARLAPHQGNDPRDLGFAVKNIGLKD